MKTLTPIIQFPALRIAAAVLWTTLMTIALLQPSRQPLIGAPTPPNYPWEYELFLSTMHLVAFAGFTVLWTWVMTLKMEPRRALTLIVVIALIYGVTTEFLQNFVPDRGVQLADIAVNAFAILAVAWVIQRWLTPRRVSRWVSFGALGALVLTACTVPPALFDVYQSRLNITPTPADPPAQTALPDLEIVSLWQTLDPTKRCMEPDITMGILVTVRNNGSSDAQAFDVTVSVEGREYGRLTVPDLMAGQSGVMLVPSGWSTSQFTAVVDVNDSVRESNENNNQYQAQLPMPTPYVPCTPTP